MNLCDIIFKQQYFYVSLKFFPTFHIDFQTPLKTPKLTINKLAIIHKIYGRQIAGKQLEENGMDDQLNEEFVVDTSNGNGHC